MSPETAVITHPAATAAIARGPRYCSLLKYVTLCPGTIADYHRLSRYHYRDACLGPVAAVWTLRQHIPLMHLEHAVIGVIVYTYPAPNCAARNAVLGPQFSSSDRAQSLRQLNQSIRTISRVVIDPAWRGLGLAAWLVRRTLPRLNVPYIESLAVMGRFNPFLEKAGMKRYPTPDNKKTLRLALLLSELNIPPTLWHDPEAVHERIVTLNAADTARLERGIHAFLGPFGKRRKMSQNLERTDFICRKLAYPPAYFLWRNQDVCCLVKTG